MFGGENPRRGRLSNIRTGKALQWAVNPEKVGVAGGNNLVIEMVPGTADPVVRWASGKAKIYSIKLQLNAELSYRRRGGAFENGANAASAAAAAAGTLTILEEIRFLEQFSYPVDPNVASANYGPDRVVLTYGPMFPGTPCLLQDIDIDVTGFTPDLDPYMADVTIKLVKTADLTTFADEIWR